MKYSTADPGAAYISWSWCHAWHGWHRRVDSSTGTSSESTTSPGVMHFTTDTDARCGPSGAGWMNSTTGAGTWITAGAGEMYSTATFCGNCRGVWGSSCSVSFATWASWPLSKRPAASASNLARICFNTPDRSVNYLWEQMDFRLRLRPLNAQILQDRRQDRLLLGAARRPVGS